MKNPSYEDYLLYGDGSGGYQKPVVYGKATISINGQFLGEVKDLQMTPTPDPWPNKYTGGKTRMQQSVWSGTLLRIQKYSTHTEFYLEAEITGEVLSVTAVDNTGLKWNAGDTIWFGQTSVFIVPRHASNEPIELPRYS